MRAFLIGSALILCCSGRTFAQTLPGSSYFNRCQNSSSPGNGMAWTFNGMPMTAIPLRYPIPGESCGLLYDFRAYLPQYTPRQPVMFVARSLQSTAGHAALSWRLTSDSLGFRYRIGGFVIKWDIGEHQVNRPNARVFLVQRVTGGLLQQVQASGGIGFYF